MSFHQSVIITGAASGIAYAAAELLRADGWTIVPVDRDADALSEACDKLKEQGVRVTQRIAAAPGSRSRLRSPLCRRASRSTGM
ncbi:SDR family NAD(P)-dependent oxidoreductase [Nocardia jinanensis]|uniref:SDR family NAD(P)-dependent oxidoreductase n=1 Tax=Nocardia jinanensis TaxID=382504 RepID=UPI0009EBFDF9